jgi:hypothetical protein
VLAAIERRWAQAPDRHLGEMMMGALESQGLPWHPLGTTWDGRLIELLAEAWPSIDLGDAAASAEDSANPWTPLACDVVLGAIEKTWTELVDFRLGQAIHIAFRKANPDLGGHALFNLEDGNLLAALGNLTPEEQRYASDEPAARRQGWTDWMTRQPG